MADKLATTAVVKRRLTIVDGNDDALLDDLNEAVSAWIQEQTGRRFIAEAGVTFPVDTQGGHVIEVPRGIRAVTALGVASTDQPDTGGTYVAIAAADILLRPLAQERRPGWPPTLILTKSATRFSWALNGAQITGDVDFATIPTAIAGIAADAVVAAYQDRKSGTSGVLGAEDAAGVPWASYFAERTGQWRILQRYRIGSGRAGIG